jgi:acyl carrier protein
MGGFNVSDVLKLDEFFQAFFEQRGVILPELWQDYDFVAAGVLDSFEILTMIMALEVKLGVHIPATLIADPNNATLGMLANSIVELV